MYGLDMVKGLLVTLKNFTKKPFTTQYPEERLRQHPRFRGEEFAWYEERCTGCASCAKYCPLGIIEIVTSVSGSALPRGTSTGWRSSTSTSGGVCSAACALKPVPTTPCSWAAASKGANTCATTW